MNDLITQFTPQILDFMVVALLLCGAAVRLHKGLYNSLVPLAVIVASAVCGLVLSAVLTGPIAERVIPALTERIIAAYDSSILRVEEYDALLAKLEKGMTEEAREALILSRYASAAKEAAQDAGEHLHTVNDELLTDESIDAAVSAVEDAGGKAGEAVGSAAEGVLGETAGGKLSDALLRAAREALEEKGLTGDAAREYIRQAGDALVDAGDAVLTDENVDAAINAVQNELTAGAEHFAGDGTEARAGRDAIRAAADEKAAAEAAISALLNFLVPRYVRVFVFLAGWAAFLAVLTILKNTLYITFELPTVKQADKAGGAALGFVEAAVLLWAVLWTVRYLGFNVFQELAKDTMVLRFFT